MFQFEFIYLYEYSLNHFYFFDCIVGFWVISRQFLDIDIYEKKIEIDDVCHLLSIIHYQLLVIW